MFTSRRINSHPKLKTDKFIPKDEMYQLTLKDESDQSTPKIQMNNWTNSHPKMKRNHFTPKD